MNTVYVKDEGCLAIVLKEYTTGVKARWFIDGVMYTGFLTDDEFLDMDELIEEGE